MLVITRGKDQEIVIDLKGVHVGHLQDKQIRIRNLGKSGTAVRLGVEADKRVER